MKGILSAFRVPRMHNVLANAMKGNAGNAVRNRAPVNHLAGVNFNSVPSDMNFLRSHLQSAATSPTAQRFDRNTIPDDHWWEWLDQRLGYAPPWGHGPF